MRDRIWTVIEWPCSMTSQAASLNFGLLRCLLMAVLQYSNSSQRVTAGGQFQSNEEESNKLGVMQLIDFRSP